MKICHLCWTQAMTSTKICHSCQTQAMTSTKICYSCQTQAKTSTQICHSCWTQAMTSTKICHSCQTDHDIHQDLSFPPNTGHDIHQDLSSLLNTGHDIHEDLSPHEVSFFLFIFLSFLLKTGVAVAITCVALFSILALFKWYNINPPPTPFLWPSQKVAPPSKKKSVFGISITPKTCDLTAL